MTGPFAARFEEVTLNRALPTDVWCEAAHRREAGKLVAAPISSLIFHDVFLPAWGFSLCLSLACPCETWQQMIKTSFVQPSRTDPPHFSQAKEILHFWVLAVKHSIAPTNSLPF